jgi:hypothetical protein
VNWQRVTAAELEVGDKFAQSRAVQPMELIERQPPAGEKSQYLVVRSPRMNRDYRIRPRHTTKFWRVEKEEA